MNVTLDECDRQILDGECGEAARLAMSVVGRMADVVGAEELMDVSQAHIDACGLLSEGGLELAETLARGGGRVRVPTTLNMGPLDLQDWRAWGVPKDFAAKALRQADAYAAMGCVPTWTCAPYQGYLAPRFGQQIAWGESNAIAYANSVLGARTERYGDFMDICAAITGRVPRYGLHQAENRRGQILLRLAGFGDELLSDTAFYCVLGHLMGPLAGERVPVIEGLPPTATDDQLKALCAAAASSGAVALFHALGLTPEAPSREAAFQGHPPEETIEVGPEDWCAARDDLSTAEEGAPLDLVTLGCPHFSYDEFRGLAAAFHAHGGKGVHDGVAFIITTSRQACALAESSGILDELLGLGVRVTRDTCLFHSPIVPPETSVAMTNSGKFAYYAPGELNVNVAFGTLDDCVRSAMAGRVCRGER
jgi:hypothetical protein